MPSPGGSGGATAPSDALNGRFRDECLNEHVFTSLEEAAAITKAWRQDYNQNRPHSARDLLSPAEYAAKIKKKEPQILGGL